MHTHTLMPPPRWRLPVIVLLGAGLGLAGLVFRVSRAHSYLSDNPAACVNCHVMAPQYATWFQSRHREVASCSDCHVPHDNPIRHYAFKASDGARHAFMFTFRLEPQVIRIHRAGQRVVQENCVRCHVASVHATRLVEAAGDAAPDQAFRCWACHRETPHGRVRGLAAVPYEHVPLPGPVTRRGERTTSHTETRRRRDARAGNGAGPGRKRISRIPSRLRHPSRLRVRWSFGRFA